MCLPGHALQRDVSWRQIDCDCAPRQVLLLIRQMEATATTATAARVSLLCIGQQAIMDAYLCLLHLTTGVRHTTGVPHASGRVQSLNHQSSLAWACGCNMQQQA